MPTVSTGLRRSFDNTNLFPLDLVDALDALDPRDVPLLTVLGMGSPSSGANSLGAPGCFHHDHRWDSDELVPTLTTLAAAYTAGSGSITVASGTAEYFQLGDMIRIGEADTGNIARVEALNTTTDVLTITAGLGNSTDAAAANGDNVNILGQAAIQGETALANPRTTDLERLQNYTQIFRDVVRIPRSVEQARKYHGITSEVSRQEAKKLQELALKLEKAALYGTRVAPSSTAGGAMGGIVEYIARGTDGTTNSTNGLLVDGAAGSFDEADLKTLLRNIWNQGGMPTHCLVNGFQAQQVADWAQPFVRTERSEETYGIRIGSYVSAYGIIEFVLNRHLDESEVIVFSRDKLGIGPFAESAFFSQDLAVTGDSKDRQVIGEYTMEVHGPTRCHGMMYNLSTS
jgi:hypothetical protein